MVALWLSALLLFVIKSTASMPYYGVQVGSLTNQTYGLTADVYLVNRTHLILNNVQLKAESSQSWSGKKFEIPMQYKFYVSTSDVAEPIMEAFEIIDHQNGDFCRRISNNLEAGFTGQTLIMRLPRLPSGQQTSNKEWTYMGIISEQHWQYLSAVEIGTTRAPEPYCCITDPVKSERGIVGAWYNVGAGPIEVLDAKTLRVPDFTFQGSKPPDGWFFAGTGTVGRSTGKKALIQGRDSKELHCAMTTDYSKQDMLIQLAGEQTVYDVDYLGVYCYAVGVDFGHVKFQVEQLVPPFIPPIRDGPIQAAVVWTRPIIADVSGGDLNLKFARGPPGGAKARAMRGICAELSTVWYVNGEITPEIWLLRGKTYKLQVYSGWDHPLYVTDEETGGWARKPANEKPLIKNYAGQDGKAYGPECLWRQSRRAINPDDFDTFAAYKTVLDETCHDGEGDVIEWQVPADAPDTLYYNSYKSYNMGGPIRLCRQITITADQPNCVQ